MHFVWTSSYSWRASRGFSLLPDIYYSRSGAQTKTMHSHEGVPLPVGWTHQTPQPSNDTMSRFLQLNNTLSLGQHRVWKRMTVKWADAKPGDAALDVCCGSGDLAFVLAEAVGPSGKVS